MKIAVINLLGLQLKLLHNAYHILPTLHTILNLYLALSKVPKQCHNVLV